MAGKKGRSGRHSVKEETILAVKKRIYKEVLDEILPDTLLAEKHLELLTVPKKVRTYIKGDLESEYEEVDTNAIKAGLDMAYKIRGDYAAEKRELAGINGERLFPSPLLNGKSNADNNSTEQTTSPEQEN